MKFMMMVKADKNSEAGLPPSPERMAKIGQVIEEMTKAGVVVAMDGLLPSSKGFRIRSSGGKVTVTDGPFTEAKEIIAGYAIVEAKSKEEAVELAKRFWEAHGDGEGEVLQVMDQQGRR
jgi:hypothetical protein